MVTCLQVIDAGFSVVTGLLRELGHFCQVTGNYLSICLNFFRRAVQQINVQNRMTNCPGAVFAITMLHCVVVDAMVTSIVNAAIGMEHVLWRVIEAVI
jgi:hypothetical protein